METFEAVVRWKTARNAPDASAFEWRHGSHGELDRASVALTRLVERVMGDGKHVVAAFLEPLSMQRRYGAYAVRESNFGGWKVVKVGDERNGRDEVVGDAGITYGAAIALAKQHAQDDADAYSDWYSERYADPEYVASLTQETTYEPPFDEWARDPERYMPPGSIDCDYVGEVVGILDRRLYGQPEPDDMVIRARTVTCDEGELLDPESSFWVKELQPDGTLWRIECPQCGGKGHLTPEDMDRIDAASVPPSFFPATPVVGDDGPSPTTLDRWDATGLFRTLDDGEIAEFKAWARANYRVGQPISPVWHPTTRAECMAMNIEAFGMEVAVTG